MPLEDLRGLSLSGASLEALDCYETALDAVLSFHGDPIGTADAALALDPTLVAAELLKAHTFAFSLHPGLQGRARASLAAAEGLAMNSRERGHVAATSAWLAGDLATARRHFDAILADWPRDLLALMFAHQADFFAAAEAALLERPTVALRVWPEGLPGRGYLLAMRAFGLEEAGRFAEAEALAAAALEANRRDAWAIHAMAHVLEMQGRDDDGIAWYRERRADWAEDCFFAVHNWWHWALYHVDRDEPAAALALYDQGLAPQPHSITLNLCDAGSLLWRLQLAGDDVGDRFAVLADAVDAPARQPIHVFTDVHAMLIFVGAGRLERAAAHLAALETIAGAGDHGRMLREFGLPVCRALLAFAKGSWREALHGLKAAMPNERQLSGSRAQRDVLTMTLIEAALRAGDSSTAQRLLRARRAIKPHSHRVARDLARCR
jgi:tetratricopeptide (TPR) repeat protein